MEQSTSLTSLMVVVALAFLVPVLLHRFKLKVLPVVVAEIVVGLIIGKSGFNVVGEDAWLHLLSLFGFIFLMFLSGVEIDFSMFQQQGRAAAGAAGGGSIPDAGAKLNPFKIAITMFVGILILSFAASWGLVLLGLIDELILMTIMIATISLGVVVPVLKEKKMMQTQLGQTILLVTVISDFVTMIMLAVYISMLSRNVTKILLLLLFFVVAFAVYRFIKRSLKGSFFRMLDAGSSQIGTRAVFALILLFVVLSESLGVENILGAFLAGVIVSLLVTDKNLLHQLDSFGFGFLIPIFFVMVGVKLNLRELFADPKALLLIPILLVLIFVTKMLPAFYLRKWFSRAQVWGSGILLSSTLSLVIAASTIALELHIIDDHLHSALILVAVLSCIIFPVLFNKIFPKEQQRQTSVSIIGANHITMPISLDLQQDGYKVALYTERICEEEKRAATQDFSRFALTEIPNLKPGTLEEFGAFRGDILVIGTTEDELNINLARKGKELGIPHIVLRVEAPELMEEIKEEGVYVFSTLYSSRMLLKALIEHPSTVRLIAQNDDSIQEIRMLNADYQDSLLRELPFLGDTLILRIYRGDSFIIPHGNTLLKLHDRLLVSGSVEHLEALKRELG